MKKRIRTIIGIIVGIIIGVSTTVGATTIFNSKDITYSNSATSKTNVKDSLDELYNKTTNYVFYKPLASIVSEGDYISMTPTGTSYKPPSILTGCMNDSNCTQNTINPSELNLWRVIKKNDDGTVDVVSNYVSSTKVYFYGKTGYLNLVGALNTIAAQYTNEKYVSETRYMGFNGQTEFCDDLICPSQGTYSEDTTSVNNVFKTLIGQNVKTGTATAYWLASRQKNTPGPNVELYDGVKVNTDGSLSGWDSMYVLNTLVEKKVMYSIRPILTLKSNIQIKSGDGKSASTAYQLS